MESFCDDFENDDFMNVDAFEDSFDEDLELDYPLAGDTEPNEAPDDAESKDDLTAKDAFLAGSFASWAYEEGFEEGRRKRLLKEQSKRRNRKKFQ